jgi:hypothetical protein
MDARKCLKNRHRSTATIRDTDCVPEILREFPDRSGDDARMPCSLDTGDIMLIARRPCERRLSWMHA